MERVEKVSIGGMAFTLERNAYDTLNRYMSELKAFYAEKEGGEEILDDIEERIAELIIEKQKQTAIVSESVIREIIGTLGDVKELCADGGNASDTGSQPKIRKRLYRNPYNKIISGVMGGLGAYFRTDPVWFRSIFAVLTLACFLIGMVYVRTPLMAFAGFIVYIILWICMPMARTIAQKNELFGRSGDLRDLERTPEYEYSKPYFVKEHRPSPLAKAIGRGFEIFIGSILLISTIFISISLIIFSILYFCNTSISIRSLLELWGMSGWMQVFTIITFSAAVALPLLWLLYISIRLLFKVHRKYIGLTIFCLWIASLIAASIPAGILIRSAKSMSMYVNVEEMTLPSTSDTLTFRMDMPADENGRLAGNYKYVIDSDLSLSEIDVIGINPDKNAPSILVYPSLKISFRDSSFFQKHDMEIAPYVRYVSRHVGRNLPARMSKDGYMFQFEDGIFTLYPSKYDTENLICPVNDEIHLYIPEGMTVDRSAFKIDRIQADGIFRKYDKPSDKIIFDIFD